MGKKKYEAPRAMFDAQRTLDLLLPVFKSTRSLSGVTGLSYNEEARSVTATFKDGRAVRFDVSYGTDAGMLMDAIRECALMPDNRIPGTLNSSLRKEPPGHTAGVKTG